MEQKVKKSTIPTNFCCNICNKFYASHSSLCHHNTKFHKIESNTNVTIPVTNVTIPVTNVTMSTNNNLLEKKNICEYCNKNFATRHSKSEHKKKSCKSNPNNNNNINTNNENISFKNEINELKDKINLLLNSNKIHPKTLQKINTQNNNINNTNNNINNINNINNNINNINNINNNINVTYVKFGNENLSEILSEKEMKKILSHLRLSVEESIKMVHFNNERPQYKNIFITNMQNNLAYIFNGNNFEVKSKEYVLYDLLNNHLNNIESFIEDNNIEETLKNKHLFKFIRELNNNNITKNYNLNNIKRLIYNNSDKLLLKKLNKLKLNDLNNNNTI